MSAKDNYTILDVVWFTTGNGTCLGAVAIKTRTDNWKAYIGVGSGIDEDLDAHAIAVLGAKVPLRVAVALFPQLDQAKWVS